MNKKKALLLSATAILMCALGAMSIWEFRMLLCNISQQTICIEILPPPKHIQQKRYERGKEIGVNF